MKYVRADAVSAVFVMICPYCH